jgi:hypothetical protein
LVQGNIKPGMHCRHELIVGALRAYATLRGAEIPFSRGAKQIDLTDRKKR